MNCFHKLSRSNILSVRKEYLPKSEREKSLWIKDYIRNNIIDLDSTRTIRWHIDGKDVCKSCWIVASTVTPFKLKNCYKVSHASKGVSRQTNRMSSTLAWLSNYFTDICEKMPTKDEFHLPCFILWKDILKELNVFLTKEGHKQITLSYFTLVMYIFFQYLTFQIRKKHFKHVKAPKYTRQGKCDTCIELKEKRKQAKTEEEKQQFHKLFVEVFFQHFKH